MSLRQRLSYVNVTATLALFLVLGGGAVWAAGKIQTRELAGGAVQTRNIARDAVSSSKAKNSSLNRSKFVSGSFTALPASDVSGGPVTPASGSPFPPTGGTTIPLTGTPTFTPATKHAYLLQVGVRSNPVEGAAACTISTVVSVNGNVAAVVNTGSTGGDASPNGSSSVAVGLTSPGQPQTITAQTYDASGFSGNPCGSGTAVRVHADVIEFG